MLALTLVVFSLLELLLPFLQGMRKINLNDLRFSNSYLRIATNLLEHFPTNTFSLPQVNSAGMISTNKSLDREDIPFYTLIVQASDKGSPPLTETVSVNVTILDVNDNPPVFSENPFTVTVSENIPVGSRFLNVTASDADIGDNALLTWSIMSGNTGDVMAIEPSTGRLYNVGK